MFALTFFLATATAQPVCDIQQVSTLPPALAGWATTAQSSGEAVPGKGFSLALSPMKSPSAAGRSGYEGKVTIRIANTGRYAVAANDRVWIDVLAGGTETLKSLSHEHGPACSGIRKIVVFNLTPGDHIIRFEGNPTNSLRALVTRWP